MRILIDTNILLAREPYANEARDIWVACEQQRCMGFVAAISITNIWYIGRRMIANDRVRQHIASLLTVLDVAPVNGSVLNVALNLPTTDFEDGVQISSAVAVRADAIVTRNIPDFANSPLPILTPTELLAQLATS